MSHTRVRYEATAPAKLGEALNFLGLEGVEFPDASKKKLHASAIGLLNLSERGTLFRCSRGAVVVRADHTMITFNKLGL
ncbi:hypothetical protein ACFYOC_24215 [Nocardiopsis alba]|uniref:hypothetical protein n=1 Tax=Nocardiopsis alba TaxID=53437 RepID=UPI00367976E3